MAVDARIIKLLSLAVGEVGVQEDPPGSNRGQRVEEYQAITGTAKGSPWCGCFCAWCFHHAGYALDKVWLLAGARNWFADPKKIVAKPQNIQPGDVFGVRNGSGRIVHVGLIRKYEDGVLHTVEGNSNEGGSREGTGVYARERKHTSNIVIARWT